MSDFLDNLKKAVEEGEFNSDAAKKINEIDERANDFSETKTTEQMEESLIATAAQEGGGIKTVDKEKLDEMNSEYVEKMREQAKEEEILGVTAGLMNLEMEVNEKLYGFGTYIRNLKEEFKNVKGSEFLLEKIEEFENKYDFSNVIAGDEPARP